MPVSFTIPTPPSANHLFRNVKGVGRVKAKHYEDFQRMAVAAVRRQKVPSFDGRVILVFGIERMDDRSDIDNRLKGAIDALVVAGIIQDDRFVTALWAAWLPPANGLTHVIIAPATEPLRVEFRPATSGACGSWFLAPSNEGDHDGHQPQ
nr:RusA family crossover junction endodeoxyribonuclease [Jiella avicenniae]